MAKRKEIDSNQVEDVENEENSSKESSIFVESVVIIIKSKCIQRTNKERKTCQKLVRLFYIGCMLC